MKWAPTFSTIYYEQVALLHPPNRLAPKKLRNFCPNMFHMSRRTV